MSCIGPLKVFQQVKRSELAIFVYLVEHRVVALPDASPLGLPGYGYLDDGLDVDAWQLAALDDPHTNLNPEEKFYDPEQIETAKITMNRPGDNYFKGLCLVCFVSFMYYLAAVLCSVYRVICQNHHKVSL